MLCMNKVSNAPLCKMCVRFVPIPRMLLLIIRVLVSLTVWLNKWMLPKDFLHPTTLILIPIIMVRGIIIIFHGCLQMLRILRPSLADLPLLVFKTRDAPPSSHQAPSGSSDIDKVISALGTLTSVVQNVDSKVQCIESKMHIVDSHSHSIAKLETQLG